MSFGYVILVLRSRNLKSSAPLCFYAPLPESIHGDCDDDDDADDDFLYVCGPVHLDGAVAEDGHYEGTDHGAKNAARAAAETCAANDDRGDDVEFETDGTGGVALREAGELHKAGEAEENSGETVNDGFVKLDADAAEAGGGFVGADGEDVTAKNGALHDQGHETCKGDGYPNSGGDGKKWVIGIHEISDGAVGRRADSLTAGEPFCGTSSDAHHTESNDEGHHAKAGYGGAVY